MSSPDGASPATGPETAIAYPALFTGSDAASLAAQHKFLWLYRLRLTLLATVSAVGVVAGWVGLPDRVPPLVIAIALLIVLVISSSLRDRSYEKVWFDGRAVAESVKTATWRYMMHVPPFDTDDEAEAEAEFVKKLVEIRRTVGGIESHLPGFTMGNLQITDGMRAVRALPLAARKDLYLRERVGNQKDWYLRKAAANRREADRWFWVSTAVQALALCLTVFEAASGSRVEATPLLVMVVSTVLAWTEVRRHNELARSYALAGQELSELEALAQRIADPEEFAQFVTQAESTISREHTLWCARREVWLQAKLDARAT